MPAPQSYRWDFHGLAVEGHWDAAAIGDRWQATFASRPAAAARAPTLRLDLELVEAVPPAPAEDPDFQDGALLAYYLDPAARHDPSAGRITAQFPRYGQLIHDLAAGTTQGVITGAALASYGVFEDLLAIALSPHLRRRGRYLLHAFAACPAPEAGDRGAVLLVGDIGAGKTTTGLALLHGGWKLLSNDSPMLAASGDELRVLAYPGPLSAYADTLARFAELDKLDLKPAAGSKLLFAAESVYANVWQNSARPGAIIFPHVEAVAEHRLEPLSAPEALAQILPHAIERWDRVQIAPHLATLRQLVQTCPAYRLRLGPDTNTLPAVISSALR